MNEWRTLLEPPTESTRIVLLVGALAALATNNLFIQTVASPIAAVWLVAELRGMVRDRRIRQEIRALEHAMRHH